MRKICCIIHFYQSFVSTSTLITFICAFFIARHGTSAFTTLFGFKVKNMDVSMSNWNDVRFDLTALSAKFD